MTAKPARHNRWIAEATLDTRRGEGPPVEHAASLLPLRRLYGPGDDVKPPVPILRPPSDTFYRPDARHGRADEPPTAAVSDTWTPDSGGSTERGANSCCQTIKRTPVSAVNDRLVDRILRCYCCCCLPPLKRINLRRQTDGAGGASTSPRQRNRRQRTARWSNRKHQIRAAPSSRTRLTLEAGRIA